MEVSLSGLPDFVADFVAGLPQSAGEHAYLVGLVGELGAGKTTFVQKLAKVLGARESVTSPTFILARRYAIDHPPFQNLVHIDAYRLSAKERDTLGLGEYLQNPRNLVVVEWPERLPGGTPQGTPLLTFTVTGETTREIAESHEG